ncbi:MAG: phosphonopyruvate decarboxylase [Aestuariibacter sp.]
MIEPKGFCDLLQQHGLSFFCGVPDSLLKNLCTYIDSNFSAQHHLITANEGNAVAVATGRFLGEGKPAVVYMQNSGLGNAVNPLVSLADSKVYGIPMLLVIGWRGEPEVKDEPQHIKQGEITLQQLDLLGIPYCIIDSNSEYQDSVTQLLQHMNHRSKPVAIIVRKGTFAPVNAKDVESKPEDKENTKLTREDALKAIVSAVSGDELVVSTTGKTSRELFEIRVANDQPTSDFLTVGGMGHTASIAQGVALAKPERKVIALDGDGSMLMHMGALPVIAQSNVPNLIHIVLNNGCHESVGGQPTVAQHIDIETVATGAGYKQYSYVDSIENIQKTVVDALNLSGPTFIEINIQQGSRSDLGRPSSTPKQNKELFMAHASKGS